MGLGCARNRMIEEAQGRYIYFMDSDDLLTENAIALLMEQAVKYDADIVYGSMEKVLLYDHGRRERSADYAYRVFLEENEFASWVYQRYDMIQASTCNFLIKLDIYRSNHIAYKPINYWEDFTTTMDLPTYVTRVVMLPDVTYLYMCRTGSMSNYQQREHIDKAEIEQTMQAVAMIKASSGRLLGKPYFPRRMYKVMLTCFYVVCTVLKNEGRISPPFTSRELRDFMRYPVALSAVWSRGGWPLRHLLLYVMGALTPSLSVVMMRLLGRAKKLI
jgi:glycosyltransferase involved in cell wall biosynthesis